MEKVIETEQTELQPMFKNAKKKLLKQQRYKVKKAEKCLCERAEEERGHPLMLFGEYIRILAKYLSLDSKPIQEEANSHRWNRQIKYCYAVNGRSASPAHLWLISCVGEMQNHLQRLPGYDKCAIEKGTSRSIPRSERKVIPQRKRCKSDSGDSGGEVEWNDSGEEKDEKTIGMLEGEDVENKDDLKIKRQCIET
ncbi:unnamed protein product [Fraxinus pennsylvanica]|uniref:Uncharacterized protein n=1 Tax=Fraxinus pennsylvanica TaxID=56036 RepID=A0AAD2E375_9LAMI|nr:unnamed protein product [Fraxinus pennsylvanica]